MKKVPKSLVLAFFLACMMIFYGCKKNAEILTLSTTSVSTITTTSAETGGTVSFSEGVEVTARGVCWTTTHSPTLASNKTIDGSGFGYFASSMAGLTPNTTYYVRAYATSSTGTVYGNEISFISTQVTLPTVTTSAIAFLTSTFAVSGGDVKFNGGTTVTDWGVCWSTSTSRNPSTADTRYNITGGKGGNGSFTGYLSGLTPGTTYFLRAYAINSTGTAYGDELSFTAALEDGPIIFNNDLTYGSLSDIDGNTYKTIQIGTQQWMAENLKTTKYSDGTSIPDVTDGTEWENLTTGGYSWYANNASVFKATYGALYNWYAVTDNRNLCPTGWHMPTYGEWNILATYLGGEEVAGGKVKETGTTHWLRPNAGAINETGFTGLPAGGRYFQEGMNPDNSFLQIGYESSWWSATSSDRFSTFYDSKFGLSNEDQALKTSGLSVRCLKDN